MPDIVDAFVVSLGIDPTQYNEEIKKYREDRKRLADEDEGYSKRQQREDKKTQDGIRQLRNETAGFLLMLAGATGVQQFASNLLSGDAATGRFAANIGMATERVAVWEEAVKRAGGQAGDAQSALRSIFGIFQNYQLLGDLSKSGDLAFFGLHERDLQNPENALMRIAEVARSMPRADVEARLSRLGLDGAMSTLLSGDRGEVSAVLRDVERLGVATAESAEAAQDFDAALADIAQTIKAEARPGISRLAEILTDLADNQDLVNVGLAVGVGALGALGIAALVAYWPLAALAAVIGTIAYNWQDLKRMWNDDWFTFKEDDTSFLDHLRSGWDSMWNEPWFGIKRDNKGWYGRGGSAAGASGGGGIQQALANMRGVAAGGSGLTLEALRPHFIAQESSGDYSAINRGTGALGAYQVMPATGRTLAGRLGMPWRPDLMRRSDAEGRAYQDAIGGAAIQEAIDNGGGDMNTIAQYYHGGSNRRIWGPRTQKYGMEMVQRVAGGSYAPRGPQGGRSSSNINQTNTTSVGQVIVYTPATDAEGISRDIRSEMAKRGLVVQAGTGLQP